MKGLYVQLIFELISYIKKFSNQGHEKGGACSTQGEAIILTKCQSHNLK